jgi:hypothetical protein
MKHRLSIPGPACPVCSSREVRFDAVEHDGWLLLAECPRCEHRWTQPHHQLVLRAPVRVAMRTEVANAA